MSDPGRPILYAVVRPGMLWSVGCASTSREHRESSDLDA
jgi:hypothetical protein